MSYPRKELNIIHDKSISEHGAWFGNQPAVRLLMQAGAGAGDADQRGRSSETLARQRGHTALADEIKRYAQKH